MDFFESYFLIHSQGCKVCFCKEDGRGLRPFVVPTTFASAHELKVRLTGLGE